MASSSCPCSDQSCQKSVPVNLGTSYFYEKSPSFYKNPREFFKKHLNEERVFVCRFAMKPCFVLASNSLVKELLNSSKGDTYNGLYDFFFGLFGDNILFADDLQSKHIREILIPMMQTDTIKNYKPILEDLVSKFIINELSTNEPVVPYEVFKRFATMLSLKLFLNLENQEAEELSKLSTSHWHGIISVPLSVKVPFLVSSSYRKAVQARDQILDIIAKRLENQDSTFLKEAREKSRQTGAINDDFFKNTILVFVCALIPKALASILTSFMDTSGLWHEKLVNSEGVMSKENLSNIFLEIVRLWPPFFGGLRVAKEDMDLGSFHVPQGYGIFYANFLAHRDPDVFEKPEDFIPERWNGSNAGDEDKIFGFGSGPHRCIGENLMRDVMQFVGGKLVNSFTWDHLERPMERDIKCLPVLRPRNLKPIIMKRR